MTMGAPITKEGRPKGALALSDQCSACGRRSGRATCETPATSRCNLKGDAFAVAARNGVGDDAAGVTDFEASAAKPKYHGAAVRHLAGGGPPWAK